MADITIEKRNKPKSSNRKVSNGNAGETRGRPKIDSWAGTMDGDYNCIFCGHDCWEHGALRLMVRSQGKKNRKSIGLYHLNCETCANAKNTSQVVCYKISDGMLEAIKGAGYEVC